ncbi:MAG TPA: squalene synthase HpnC [Candidatus Polarisedimenticolia bacterium]|nr:squalene synthase HpnC [Candidatus Polarisedimenticolia bacterium]
MVHPSARSQAFATAEEPRGAAPSLRQAREFCARLAREHYENFPVASWLLPGHVRPAVQAIYAFARIADDFADEAKHEGQRLKRLDEWERMLSDCFRGEAFHPVFVALREAIGAFGLPPQPFHDLLAAFRMDVERDRHPDEASLMEYCRLSANPIGRLLLRLFGYDRQDLARHSDAVCTALQLANHWQDVAVDLRKGRIYLPEDARINFGVTEEDLFAGRVTERFRALMRDRVQRTRELFVAGRPLCDAVRGRFRWELRLTWLGGQRILDGIESQDFDVLTRRPRLGATDALIILWRAVAWRT